MVGDARPCRRRSRPRSGTADSTEAGIASDMTLTNWMVSVWASASNPLTSTPTQGAAKAVDRSRNQGRE